MNFQSTDHATSARCFIGSLALACLAPGTVIAQAINDPQSQAPTGAARASPPIVERLRVPRIDTAPTIDGRLDDAVWQRVPPVSSFVQVTPKLGAAPALATELRLAHDGRHLYLAIRASVPDPRHVVALTLTRDAEALEQDDHVSLVLDPQGQGANGFFFRMNALGAQRDGLIFDGQQVKAEWDGLWRSAANIGADAWTLEAAIPLALIGATLTEQPWRFNVERFSPRTNERVRLHGVLADRSVDALPQAGWLEGPRLDDASWGLRLRPSLRWTKADGDLQSPRPRASLQPALDAAWQPTAGVTTSLTLNTDFADTQPDDARVNLSRFALFTPEKRSFFTQDGGRFAFGGLDANDEPNFLPFFSRRIGLGSSLDAGVKVSGSAGSFDFGALGVQVRRQDEAASPRVGVIRVSTAVAEDHRVGMLATRGHPDGVTRNHLEGVDHQWRGSLSEAQEVTTHAWAIGSSDSGVGRGNAYGASFRLPNDGLWSSVTWQRLGEHFSPGLGFLQEAGVQKFDGGLGWQFRREDGARVLPRLFFGNRHRLDDREHSSYLGTHVEAEDRGDVLAAGYFWEHDRLADGFTLLPGLRVFAGQHRWQAAEVFARSAARRSLSGEVYARSGGTYDAGRLNVQTLKLAWRPNAHWLVAGSATRQNALVPTGEFTALVTQVRVQYAHDTMRQQSVVWQRDNVSGNASVGWRARLGLGLGQDVLLAWDRLQPRVGVASQALSAKLVWHWSL